MLDALRELAPVTAVRGNVDTGEWASALPASRKLQLGGVVLFLLHDIKDYPAGAVTAAATHDVQVVVSGHSHKPRIQQDARGVLMVNPGSAGPRRFKLPVSAAELMIGDDGSLAPRLVDLI